MQLYEALTSMEHLIEFREGLWWPKKDLYKSVIEKESANIETIMQYVNVNTFVIQAGGHMGIWPLRYSKIFKNVFTFESDTLNYYCLKKMLIRKMSRCTLMLLVMLIDSLPWRY